MRIFDRLVSMLGKIFVPDNMDITDEGITEENLRAFLERKGVSQFLLYQSYEEIEGAGIYTQKDGRKGFILRVLPSPYAAEEKAAVIGSLLQTLQRKDAVVTISSFASQDISGHVKLYKQFHECNSDVKNRNVLKALRDVEINHLHEWVKKGLYKRRSDKLRDMILTVSVLLPPEAEDEDVIGAYGSAMEALGPMNPVNFSGDELISMIMQFLDMGGNIWKSYDDPNLPLNKLMTGPGNMLRLKKTFKQRSMMQYNESACASVLTTKTYPEDPDFGPGDNVAAFFDILGRIPTPFHSPFYAAMTFRFPDTEVDTKQHLAKARWNVGRLHGIPSKVRKKRQHLREAAKENDEIVKNLTLKNQLLIESMWSLTLFEKSEKALNRYTDKIINQFNQHGWTLVAENFRNVAFMEQMFSLPLQYNKTVEKFLNRFRPIYTENIKTYSPLISDGYGSSTPIVNYVSRLGQLIAFDPFESKDNYNIIVAGNSGAGKSFGVNLFLLAMLQSGTMIRGIDVGYSSKDVVNSVGGQYIEAQESLCVNFFTNIKTTKNSRGEEVITSEMEEIAIPIVGYMMGVDLSSKSTLNDTQLYGSFLRSVIGESLKMAFKREGREAGIKDIYSFIGEKIKDEYNNGNSQNAELLTRAQQSLFDFGHPEGKYYSYVNGVNNMDLKGDFSVTELQDFKSKKTLLPIITMMIATRTAMDYSDPAIKHIKKIMFIDEAWQFFDDPVLVAILEDQYRTIRKFNGIAMTITQSIANYGKNEATKAMWENSSWRFIYPHKSDTLKQAQIDGVLSKGEYAIAKSVKSSVPNYAECFIQSPNMSFVARIKGNAYLTWLLDQKRIDKIKKVMSALDIDETTARFFLGRREERPEEDETRSLEIALSMLANNNEESEEKQNKEAVNG